MADLLELQSQVSQSLVHAQYLEECLNFGEQEKPPMLLDFFPQSFHERQIQQFNLALIIPSNFQEDDDMVRWLLETETLNRGKVASFLTLTSDGILMHNMYINVYRLCAYVYIVCIYIVYMYFVHINVYMYKNVYMYMRTYMYRRDSP